MRVLLVVVLLCVPIMLLVKPLNEFCKMKQHKKHTVDIVNEGEQVYTRINEGGSEYENYKKLEGTEGQDENSLERIL